MRPVVASVGPLAAASATNIRTADGVAAPGPVTLDGSLVVDGVAILDQPRRVLFTTTADETANTATITGTNWSGQSISETVTLPDTATVATVLDYATVAQVSVSAALDGDLSIGTNTVAGSPWVMMDSWAYGPISVQVAVSGTVNYDIEVTSQDPNDPFNPVNPSDVTFIDCADTALVNKTANAIGQLTAVPVYARINLNSGSGSCTATFIQPGVVPQ